MAPAPSNAKARAVRLCELWQAATRGAGRQDLPSPSSVSLNTKIYLGAELLAAAGHTTCRQGATHHSTHPLVPLLCSALYPFIGLLRGVLSM